MNKQESFIRHNMRQIRHTYEMNKTIKTLRLAETNILITTQERGNDKGEIQKQTSNKCAE